MVVATVPTLRSLDLWLREARGVVAGLPPDDPRRARAESLIRQREQERAALAAACRNCGGRGWWWRGEAGGEWLCQTCHPDPAVLWVHGVRQAVA